MTTLGGETKMYGPIDMKNFQSDIDNKKRMLLLISRERNNILENLKRTTALRSQSFTKLKFYTETYCKTILTEIVRIQKWYRLCRSRYFFRTLLRADLDKNKQLLNEQLEDME